MTAGPYRASADGSDTQAAGLLALADEILAMERDGGVACRLFEHIVMRQWADQARAALAQWRRDVPLGVGRPHYLAWNGTEWVDQRRGCRYHPDDDNDTHGGAPHVHLCDRHARSPIQGGVVTDSVPIHVYPIGRCGKGLAKGSPCNRRGAWAHIRGDVQPPMILWMCSKHHDEAARQSDAGRHGDS